MTYQDYLNRCAGEYFAALLVKHDGRVSDVAREAGIRRTHAYKLLHRYGLIKPAVRGNEAWRALQ
jgi:transcriptional regulator of acetoin/glycerol metabolism